MRPKTGLPLATLLLFGFGFVGGLIAFVIGLPMPFLLGSITGAAIFIFVYENEARTYGKMHPYVRFVAISAIGTMIGSRFSPELLSILPSYWVSAVAIIPFMLIAHAGSYAILRYMGRYPVADAYFASLPGGLVEAVILGEKAGADLRALTAQHFIRILIVVVTVPVLFWITTGEVVGSLAGETLGVTEYGALDVVKIMVVGLSGLFIGRFLKIPTAHLMGPLLLAIILSVSGVITINTPSWMLHLAQYVIGVGLGSQFSGISRSLLSRALKMGLISGTYMLVVSWLFAFGIAPFVPVGVDAMFISFAAGGMAEMSLIALSLNLSPIVVALHHLFRIFLTVWMGNLLYVAFIEKRKST